MIYEEYDFEKVSPETMDLFWEAGFRHFGTHFYRYNIGLLKEEFVEVLPLRIKLSDFKLSKSQRKTINKNKDLRTVIRDCFIDEEKEKLFYIHAERFTENRPNSIYTFLSAVETASTPCELKEVCIYEKDRLAAVSFLDVGDIATSSVYAMFHPDYAKRRLGIYTMLIEIEYSINRNMKFLYPGYAYIEPSFYDYKKKFHPLEYFDWLGNWHPYKNEYTDEEQFK